MSSHQFTHCGASLTALSCGALWWPDEGLLCVSDLHLGKAERIARRGGALLPPYDTTDTLLRLRARIEELNPRIVISLGDSFDDQASELGLAMAETRMLAAMMAGRHWVWIAGNHDPGPVETSGTWVQEHHAGPLVFRHIARAGETTGEVSGHYHPKARVPLRGRSVTRPCFLKDDARLILPSFGSYTGGLYADSPALRAVMAPDALAFLTGNKVHAVPLSLKAPV